MSNVQSQRIEAILKKFAQEDYIGEAVSQLEHALQCAYFAEKCGHSDDIILACLLHDIGHVALGTPQPQMAGLGVINHEWIGARLLLEMGFSLTVAQLVGHHVNAKRYLSGKKPAYYHRLSSASKGTLKFQGGPMTAEEMAAFESLPLFKQILQVRTHDEKGKEVDLTTPSLEHYLALIDKHLNYLASTSSPIKTVYVISDYPRTNDALIEIWKTYDFDIGLSSEPQPFHSPFIYDYNLSQINQDACFLEETCQLINDSILNHYLLLASPKDVSKLVKFGQFELVVI